MKTIIVATDFSTGAENALKYASYIARFTRARIALLNVYHLSTHAMNGLISPAAIDALLEKNKKRIDEYAELASAKYNVSISGYTWSGTVDQAVEQLSSSLNADLVVMGMRGNSAGDKFFGNTCTSAISNTKIPILIVPEIAEFKMPEKMLFACDYQELPDQDELQMLKEIAESFSAELQIFHMGNAADLAAVNDDKGAQAVQTLETSFKNLRHSFKDVEGEDIMQGIQEGIREYGADILVMTPHKYGFWSSIFHQSKTCAMTFKTKIPLLSLPS